MNHLSSKRPFRSLNCRGRLIDLTQPKIMGILNITPDSFSDGGQFDDEKRALAQAERLISEGAAFLDVGAQSTRPKAIKLSASEERDRLKKIFPIIRREFPEVLLSLDTFYSENVRYGADEGVDLINDISGGQFDRQMFSVAARTGLPYVLMHIANSYEMMHQKVIHQDITLELNAYFSEKVQELRAAGVKDIVLDPGFGFGKTVEQQLQLIAELEFLGFGQFPMLVGISRKSFIYQPLGKNPLQVSAEMHALHLQLLRNGASVLRVHDVAEAQKTLARYEERG